MMSLLSISTVSIVELACRRLRWTDLDSCRRSLEGDAFDHIGIERSSANISGCIEFEDRLKNAN